MGGNLSNRQFFHGTAAKLQPGDLIHPNHLPDEQAYNQEHPEHSDFVWMSNRVRDADWYARHRGSMQGGTKPTQDKAVRNSHVYEVEPQGLHAPADTLTPGKKSHSTHVSLAPVKVVREVPHEERAQPKNRADI